MTRLKRKWTKPKFWKTFFSYLASQNDYLYIGEGAPFNRPHWWRTRIGFRLAWSLAKIIHD